MRVCAFAAVSNQQRQGQARCRTRITSKLALMLAGGGEVVQLAVHSSLSAMQDSWMRLKHCTRQSTHLSGQGVRELPPPGLHGVAM